MVATEKEREQIPFHLSLPLSHLCGTLRYYNPRY